MALELKFGRAENADSFRQQALACVVRESLALAAFTARQNMVDTAGDVVSDLYQQWTKVVPPAGVKSVKRFCQLLLVYWLQTSRQAKKYKVDDVLARPQLLSEADKQRLGFLT